MNNCFTQINKHLYLNHESIQMNKLANLDCAKVFNFCYATEGKVKKEILHLPPKKSTKIGDISAEVRKANVDIYLNGLTALINKCFEREYSQMCEK